MWAVGCIFAELIKKDRLFPSDNFDLVLEKVFWLLGTPSE